MIKMFKFKITEKIRQKLQKRPKDETLTPKQLSDFSSFFAKNKFKNKTSSEELRQELWDKMAKAYLEGKTRKQNVFTIFQQLSFGAKLLGIALIAAPVILGGGLLLKKDTLP